MKTYVSDVYIPDKSSPMYGICSNKNDFLKKYPKKTRQRRKLEEMTEIGTWETRTHYDLIVSNLKCRLYILHTNIYFSYLKRTNQSKCIEYIAVKIFL